MAERIVLCLSHSIEEYDQLRLLSGLGYDVFSIGGYIDPAHPHDPKRPALPTVPYYPEFHAAVDAFGTADNLGNAQARLPDAVLDWADVIIFHHNLPRLYRQWDERIAPWLARGNRRVIWRTVGQSVEHNEREAQPFRERGLEIVRYSPKERNIPGYAGEDALIRFYKDPADYGGWTGEEPVVINVTQHLYQRSLGDNGFPRGRQEWTNYTFWDEATRGLPRMPLGPGSEAIGGTGELSNDDMTGWLRRARAYLATGTQPASYVLNFIEALMTGIPVVSIGPSRMDVFAYGPDLFEQHEIALRAFNDPQAAKAELRTLLNDLDYATSIGTIGRRKAIEFFGRERVAADWRAFLGAP